MTLAPGWTGDSPHARRLQRQLRDKIHEVGANCVDDPGKWVDYEVPPSSEEARAMCFGCPVKTLCRQYADAANVSWGVWAGEIRDQEDV